MKKSQCPNCDPTIAVAYARYSSAGQRDVSIEQQLQDIRAYADREGYTLVHEYADHARSGFKKVERRVEFQRMLAAAKAGKFAVVIVWKTDRFARSREDAAAWAEAFRGGLAPEDARARVLERLTETGRGDFPFYAPKRRSFGIFVLPRAENEHLLRG